MDQVVLLTQNIEGFLEAKKTGAILVNMTAAYDTVWHRGFTGKQQRILPDEHMPRMMMEFVRNRIFILISGDNKQSRLHRLTGIGFDYPSFQPL